MMSLKEEQDMLLKALAYQSEQNTIGIFLPIKMLENWLQTTIQLQ